MEENIMIATRSQSKLACIAILLLATVTLSADNDNCLNAALLVGEYTDLYFDTRGATFDGPGLCMSSSPNIWYSYTASCTGEVSVSLLGSGYDTKLAAYNGTNCYPALDDIIACNDDSNFTYQSQIWFAAVAGEQYLIEIGGYATETGQGVMSITCDGEPAPGPSRDICVNAELISDVTDLPFDTSDATFDGPGHCTNGPNIWYCYTASCTGDVTVSLIGSAFDTMLAVYNGCECYPTQGDMIACNDDFGSVYQSQVTFTVIAGNL